ncbi:MAG: LytTR family DNA-binding domain-containing protein [Polaribacter sp.]|uniref:LytR/AlgR family response regulator transcription factor n=1 Tax=Polaribacter sp. TaxID=1920175 RepID=UPI002623E80E|nr:LytTR family DNA-binding domain-containing protein [uncultured Polaribacter sp.]
MNCIIIDDEKMARSILKTLCNEIKLLTVIGEYSNAIEAIKFLNDNKVDLIFLDIHMPDFNGFDFVETLKYKTKVVLITSDDQLAIKAFKYLNIVDYLLKPLSLDSLEKSIEKIKMLDVDSNTGSKTLEKKKNHVSDYIFVNINHRLIRLTINEINIIKSDKNYILITTDTETHKVNISLKKIQQRLPLKSFFRVHKSYIVNLNKIVDIEDRTIVIQKNVVPIGNKYWMNLKNRLNLI